MKTSWMFPLLSVAASAVSLVAQPPAPPPPAPPAPVGAPASPQAASTTTGNISQFNYGPDGRVDGFVVAPNTIVSLPRDWAMQAELLAKAGDQVKVTGTVTATASGMQVMQPQSLTVAGKTFSVAEPSQPAPYAGSGVIRSLNYGPQGEVNGFVLQNGIIARTPPFGASDVSVVKRGATISLSGFARVTPSGNTVVEVQTLTANGQTIAMTTAPRELPGRGKAGKRGLGAPPPAPGLTPPQPPAPSRDR